MSKNYGRLLICILIRSLYIVEDICGRLHLLFMIRSNNWMVMKATIALP